MGDVVLGALLQVLFEKIASAGIKLFLKQMNKEELSKSMKEWEKKLRIIEAVLSDAEQKQFNSQAVNLWLQNLQDLSYDVEDVLDEVATDALLLELRTNHQHDSIIGCFPFNKVSRCFTCVSEASDSKSTKYSKSIDDINDRLEAILSQRNYLGLSEQTHSSGQPREQPQETSSLVSEPVVYGRDDQKNWIIQQLLKDNDEPCEESYTVISIVGLGGIGKTTLAQSVYNDEQVKDHFKVIAWVCVSNVFDVRQITTKILKSAFYSSYNFSTLDEAHLKLKNKLACKKFLIVLDDIWSEDYNSWQQLQIPFQGAAKGSKVIITTRIKRVAMNMRATPSSMVNLKGLLDDDCWCIFKRHAAVKDDSIEMRNEVVSLCKGLPLAAKALGGLLGKEDKNKWSSILKNNKWIEEGGVLPVLRLSYHHLPQHLKRVFAYCAIFPQDHKFHEKDLVLMWMAEGFLSKDENESLEDKGRTYFQELVSRSFFERRQHSFHQDFFIMHDLIHDLARWAAGDVCHLMNAHKKISQRTRYLSFSNEVFEDRGWGPGEAGYKLRTFASFGDEFSVLRLQNLDLILQHFHYLRVLSVVNTDLKELPDCIGNLKHLRLLNLSSNKNLKELPESTSRLRNLQILCMRDCKSLRKVVTDITLLRELRHLDVKGITFLEMPFGIGKLTNLQTMNCFFTTENGPSISELKNLKDLCGSLRFPNLENVVRSEDACEARLHEKIGLDFLEMCWERTTNDIDHNIEHDVIEQLQPPKSIKEVVLHGYRTLRFPSWLGDPSFNKMVVIKLNECLRCESLPPLGQLPSLKELKLSYMNCVKTISSEFYGVGCSNPFPALKTLEFYNMKNWEKWLHSSPDDNSKAFPCLEVLSFSGCPLLQSEIPFHLPSLIKLHISFCAEMRVLLPSCPLLQKLHISQCKELSSSLPIICCSTSIWLGEISQVTGIEGFHVQELEVLEVLDIGSSASKMMAVDSNRFQKYLQMTNKKYLKMTKCHKPEISDGFGELNKLSEVLIGNSEELAVFLEKKFPPSVRFLGICDDKSVKHVSRITNRSTSLEELHILYNSYLITVDNLPLTLQHLVLNRVSIEQPAKEWGLRLLNCLQTLVIKDVYLATDSVESISDEDLRLPSCLSKLTIEGFKNLKCMSCSTFPNLTEIDINDCPKLESLGVDFPPPKLRQIELYCCELICQHCLPDPQGLVYLPQGHLDWTRHSYVETRGL